MNDAKLGVPPAETAQRDAIHIAIAPVKAGEGLKPGDHVAVIDGEAFRARDTIGIADPFRNGVILKGSQVWVLLYQNTIVGMRHHWSHPSFTDKPPEGSRAPTSEQWLREFAEAHFDGNYDRMMERARDGELCFDTTDVPDSKEEIFYVHFNAVTGLNIQGGYFRCAC